MRPADLKRLDRELDEYVDDLFAGTGRPERVRAMGWYVEGLLLDGERKSMQPMAARLTAAEPERAEGVRQALQQCVAYSDWDDEELFARLAVKVDAELRGISAMVVDDTGFAKKGTHSVGVARQYSGTMGRTDNCQVATSLHLAAPVQSVMIGARLYLPKEWTEDRARCAKAGVPKTAKFKTKWQLALGLIDSALRAGVRKRPVLADAAYGDVTEFRAGLEERHLEYLVGVSSNHVVWAPGTAPTKPPPRKSGTIGRPRTRILSRHEKPQSLRLLVDGLGRGAVHKVTWRQGSKGRETSWFGAVRIQDAHRHAAGRKPPPPIWLLFQWPPDEKAPIKFWFSNLPVTTDLKTLVSLAMMRWRVERDYQELKGELGLDHFEGRTWRGFHHHAALCAVAHGFLALQRASLPPSEALDDSNRPTTAADHPAA